MTPKPTPLGAISQSANGDLSEASKPSGALNRAEPLGGDAVEIEPAADVLARDAEITGKLRNTPAGDDVSTFHVRLRDTKRVDGQHYAGGVLCEPRAMTPGERLREIRMRARWTVEQLADAVGIAASSVRAHENGQNGIRANVAERYATALGVAPEDILFVGDRVATSPRPTTSGGEVRRVPVLGVVQAGAWSEVNESQAEPTEWVAFSEPQYGRAQLFALAVRGNSVNRHYPDGCRVVCVPAHESGIQEGDFVVVRRRRGSFVETTLKQIEIAPDGNIELWPRSDDPLFQEPLRLAQVRDADEGAEIIAVVIAKYEVGRAGRGPLLNIK